MQQNPPKSRGTTMEQKLHKQRQCAVVPFRIPWGDDRTQIVLESTQTVIPMVHYAPVPSSHWGRIKRLYRTRGVSLLSLSLGVALSRAITSGERSMCMLDMLAVFCTAYITQAACNSTRRRLPSKALCSGCTLLVAGMEPDFCSSPVVSMCWRLPVVAYAWIAPLRNFQRQSAASC